MTPDEFRETLTRLGLSQLGAARVLGVTPRAARHWALGERNIAEPAARLLRVMVALGLSAGDVLQLCKRVSASRAGDVSSPSPRAASRGRPPVSRRASPSEDVPSDAASPSLNPPSKDQP